jgi:hypothetical protein
MTPKKFRRYAIKVGVRSGTHYYKRKSGVVEQFWWSAESKTVSKLVHKPDSPGYDSIVFARKFHNKLNKKLGCPGIKEVLAAIKKDKR